jgi:hypothetical protein
MNTITATTTACTAKSGGRVRVRAAVGFGRVGVLARVQRHRLRRRDAQGWRPVAAELPLGIAARTQCCPSKHPDGYREVVLRR